MACCMYNSSSKYFMWLPSPSLMACSLLVRTPWCSSETLSAKITFKTYFYWKVWGYLFLGHKNLHLLTQFCQNCFDFLEVTRLFRVFHQENCRVKLFLKKLAKQKVLVYRQQHLSVTIAWAGTYTIKISGCCLKKIPCCKTLFYFFAEKLTKNKVFVWGVCKNFFFQPTLYDQCFLWGQTILENFKPDSNRPRYTNVSCQNQRGFWENFFELLGFKMIYSVFSQNRCAGSITNKICIL